VQAVNWHGKRDARVEPVPDIIGHEPMGIEEVGPAVEHISPGVVKILLRP
jgi:Zn-dependent alcohol dehydrogenase